MRGPAVDSSSSASQSRNTEYASCTILQANTGDTDVMSGCCLSHCAWGKGGDTGGSAETIYHTFTRRWFGSEPGTCWARRRRASNDTSAFVSSTAAMRSCNRARHTQWGGGKVRERREFSRRRRRKQVGSATQRQSTCGRTHRGMPHGLTGSSTSRRLHSSIAAVISPRWPGRERRGGRRR